MRLHARRVGEREGVALPSHGQVARVAAARGVTGNDRSALRDSAIVLFVSWRPEKAQNSLERPTVAQGGAARITRILSIVLRGSERLRCAQKEKVVASKVFRK